MKITEIREKTAPRLPQLLFWLCLLQPVLDVASYWLLALEQPTAPITLLRLLMLAAVVLTGFVLSDRKRYYVILAGILLALTAGHIWACTQWGYDHPAEDLANLLRIYQLPAMTLAFITFLRTNEDCLKAFQKGFFGALLLCALVELLSVLTGTNPYTYPNKAVGLLGWFYFANSQSAVLSVLVPVSLVYGLQAWKTCLWKQAALMVLGTALLYLFATRLAYLSLIGTLVGLALCLLLYGRLHKVSVKKSVALLLACALVAVGGYAVSPMVKNNQMVAKNKILKQADIDAKVEADEAAALAAGLEGEDLQIARLASAYDTYLTGPTRRFGLERTARWYDFSTDAGDIADVRREKLTYNDMLMEDCPGASRLFGLERGDMIVDGEAYDVENDFHGIYYLCGLTGLALCLAFVGFFLVRILWALIRRFQKTLTPDAMGCGLALCCILVHAFFTCGVLRRPNVNIYLAILLAMAYALTRKEERV